MDNSSGRKQRRNYGYATSVVTNMLLEIKDRNKDTDLAQLLADCYEIAKGQEEYIGMCGFPETDLQAKIAEDTKKDERTTRVQCMLSGHAEGNYLKLTAEMVQAKSILEIGMYTGYSAVNLADSAYCEELITLDVEPYYESFVKDQIKGTHLETKIRIIIGPADETLVQLKSESKQFDLVFIDADKKGYLNYYKYIMDNQLLSPTGVIACDNILWDAKTFNQADSNGKALHEFVDYVKNDNRVDQIIVPIRDGIFIIKQKASPTNNY